MLLHVVVGATMWSLASFKVTWTRDRRWAVLSFRLWGSPGKSGRMIRNKGMIIKWWLTMQLLYTHLLSLPLTLQVISSQANKVSSLPRQLEVDTCFCQQFLPMATCAATLFISFPFSSHCHGKWQARKWQDYPHVWAHSSAWLICIFTDIHYLVQVIQCTYT